MGEGTSQKKALRKMSRYELIDIIYALQQREKDFEEQIENLQLELQDRSIRMGKTGSIAEAALALNNIFEVAQKAADEYLESVLIAYRDENGSSLKERVDEILESAKEQSEIMMQEAKDVAAEFMDEAQEQAKSKASDIIVKAELQAGEAQEQARSKASDIITDAERKAGESEEQTKLMAANILAEAKRQAEEIEEQAKVRAADILAEAENKAKEQYAVMRAQAEQSVEEMRKDFLAEIKGVFKEHPELVRYMKNKENREKQNEQQ